MVIYVAGDESLVGWTKSIVDQDKLHPIQMEFRA